MESLTVKLLELLERDATLSPARLATMLGSDEDSIARRVDDLEQSGVIVRRKAVINWSRVGVEPVIALIEVRVSPQREVGFGSLAARISRFLRPVRSTWSPVLTTSRSRSSVGR